MSDAYRQQYIDKFKSLVSLQDSENWTDYSHVLQDGDEWQQLRHCHPISLCR